MKPFYYTPPKNNPTNQNPPKKNKTQHKTNPQTKQKNFFLL
jgi:hypothetical protein